MRRAPWNGGQSRAVPEGGAPGAFAPGATARGRKIGKIEDSIGLIILILISDIKRGTTDIPRFKRS